MYSQNIQISEWLRLEGTSRDHLIPPSYTDQSHQEHIAQNYVQLGIVYLQSFQFCRLLRQPIPVFDHSHRKCLVIMFSFTDFSLCSLLLLLSLVVTQKSLLSSPSFPSLSGIYTSSSFSK